MFFSAVPTALIIFFLFPAFLVFFFCSVYLWASLLRRYYNPLLHPVLNSIVRSVNELLYCYVPADDAADAALKDVIAIKDQALRFLIDGHYKWSLQAALLCQARIADAKERFVVRNPKPPVPPNIRIVGSDGLIWLD